MSNTVITPTFFEYRDDAAKLQVKRHTANPRNLVFYIEPSGARMVLTPGAMEGLLTWIETSEPKP